MTAKGASWKELLKTSHVCVAYPNKVLLLATGEKIMRGPLSNVINSHKVIQKIWDEDSRVGRGQKVGGPRV